MHASRHVQQGIVFPLPPLAKILQPFPAVVPRHECQCLLMAKVIIYDPLPPERCHGVHVQHGAIPTSRCRSRPRRGRIEFNPSVARKIDFNPGMCVTGADHVLRPDIVEFSTAKPCCHARGNSQSSQHHLHSRGEVSPLSSLTSETAIAQRDRLRCSGTSKLLSAPS